MPILSLPWSTSQIERLTAFQSVDYLGPMLCPTIHLGGQQEKKPSLMPTAEGWKCPRCAYRSDEAYTWMLEPFIGAPAIDDELVEIALFAYSRHFDRVIAEKNIPNNPAALLAAGQRATVEEASRVRSAAMREALAAVARRLGLKAPMKLVPVLD